MLKSSSFEATGIHTDVSTENAFPLIAKRGSISWICFLILARQSCFFPLELRCCIRQRVTALMNDMYRSCISKYRTPGCNLWLSATVSRGTFKIWQSQFIKERWNQSPGSQTLMLIMFKALQSNSVWAQSPKQLLTNTNFDKIASSGLLKGFMTFS